MASSSRTPRREEMSNSENYSYNDLEQSEHEDSCDVRKDIFRSIAWDYFPLSIENGRQGICNLCSIVLCLPTGTTTPMFNHLRAKHTAEWAKCEARKRKLANDGEPKKRRKTGLPAAEKDELDELLMEMIAIDLKPFSCVEDKGFKRLLSKLAPEYEPPCRPTFSRSLGPILYHKTREKLIAELLTDLEKGLSSISFTTDCWKSKANDNYISLTLHYLTTDFNLKNVTLGMEQLEQKHTGRNLRQTLEKMMAEWNLLNIENIPIYYVTDNARNISAAISQGGWEHFYCFAHTLQLALHDARRYTDGVIELLTKAKRIATHFHHLDPARRQFEKAQRVSDGRQPLQLKQMVETRWNSEYEMLERMLRLKKPLSEVLSCISAVIPLSGTEWQQIEHLINVLKPLYEATVISSGIKYPTLSLVIPLLHGIKLSIQNMMFDDSSAGSMAEAYSQNILDSLETRLSDVEAENLHRKATFLDPRYKNFFFSPEKFREIELQLKTEIADFKSHQSGSQNHYFPPTREPSNSERSTFWDFLKRPQTSRWEEEESLLEKEVEKEIVAYVHAVPLGPYGDAISWWKAETLKYPHLSKMAMKYLPIPNTSVESERLFSSAGDIVNEKRTALRPDTVKYLIFLYKILN